MKHISLSRTLRTAEAAGMDLGDASGKYNHLRELKRILKSMVKKQGTHQPYIEEYPTSPKDLPPAMYHTAYGDTSPCSDGTKRLGRTWNIIVCFCLLKGLWGVHDHYAPLHC